MYTKIKIVIKNFVRVDLKICKIVRNNSIHHKIKFKMKMKVLKNLLNWNKVINRVMKLSIK